MLTDRITLGDEANSPEDYLSSALGVIFPDDITNQHGDPSTSVIYASPAYGPIKLSLADPQGEDTRRLFSHHLWNSGVQIAAFIEEGSSRDETGSVERAAGEEAGDGKTTIDLDVDAPSTQTTVQWKVQGETVLEVGAGTGLSGLIAHLAGARETVISDYPAVEVLANLETNVQRNIPAARRSSCHVVGHEWGRLDPEADVFVKDGRRAFGRILVADCLWMPWQHRNLARSIEWFLAPEGEAWVVAGFHTGRAKVASFYDGIEGGFDDDDDDVDDEEGGEGEGKGDSRRTKVGLVVDRIWERDAEGRERPWVRDRGIEDVTARKRWLVVAVLKRKKQQ